MKKKTVIIIIAAVLVALGIGAAYVRYSLVQQGNKMTVDDVQKLLPAFCGVFEWQKLCEDNGIAYDAEAVENIKASYLKLTDNLVIDNGVSFANLVYIICTNAYIGADNEAYMSASEEYYDPEYMIYLNYIDNTIPSWETLYQNSIHWNISAVTRLQKAGVRMPHGMDAGLIKYYEDYAYTDFDENTKNYFINMTYYFWDKNKCEDIDISPLKGAFQEIYDNCLSQARESGYQMTTADFGYNDLFEICSALGIDITELSELSKQWDIFASESNWNNWDVDSLSCSYLTASIYYDELIGGNEKYSQNALFCDRFGSSLGLYCTETLQPQVDAVFERFSLEAER